MPNAPLTREQLFAEWRLIVTITTTVLSVASFYYLLKADVSMLLYRVDKIENNHLTHMQASMEKMADSISGLQFDQIETRTQLNSLLKK